MDETYRKTMKEGFIKELAKYLSGTNQAHYSILAQVGKPEGVQWCLLRKNTPLFGYLTEDEAEAVLTKFLA